MTAVAADVAVVIPTVGRPCLQACLDAMAAASGPLPAEVLLVDDRREPSTTLPVTVPPRLAGRVRMLASGGRGPAAARNHGWRAASAEWIAFVDDDVRVGPRWLADLHADLSAVDSAVAGVQGRVSVPLPAHRRPTDWERNVGALGTARWITADMAYRRTVLAATGGFDERFPRAFREDADLALRVLGSGHRLTRGRRCTEHPVRPAPWWISLRLQAGNADDPLMARLHGRDWRQRAQAPLGRRPAHVAVTVAGLLAVGSLLGRRHRAAAVAAGTWAAGTAELATARVLPGPRTPAEVAAMVATSVVLPPLATYHWLRGLVGSRRERPLRRADAVLFDRDGTLVHDVPYNGDPALVRPLPGARAAVDLLRARGYRLGVVSNQSGVGRGLLDPAQVAAVNARVDELLGPFDTWQVCPHRAQDGCGCRKPAPGMVRDAAAALGVDPGRVVVVGDIGSDVAAARSAGAHAVLVPTAQTRPEETAAAPHVRSTLLDAALSIVDGELP